MSRSPHDASQGNRVGHAPHLPPRLETVIHSAARGVALAGGLVSGLLHRVFWTGRRMRPPRREVGSLLSQTPEHALLGRSKDEIFRLLGPPRTATMEGLPAAGDPRPSYWQASIWYYPHDVEGHTAIAVRFHDGIVEHVEAISVHLGQAQEE